MAEHALSKVQPNYVVVRDAALRGKGLPTLGRSTLFEQSSPKQKKQWHMTQEGFQLRVSEQSIIDALNHKLPNLASPPEPV